MITTAATVPTRYLESWDFAGRSDEYLRETFEIWSSPLAPIERGPLESLYASGVAAIIEECHARALVLNATMRPKIRPRGSLVVGTHGLFEFDQDLYDIALRTPRVRLYALVKGIYDGTGTTRLYLLRKHELAAIVADNLTALRADLGA
jgi:hypothetical protein